MIHPIPEQFFCTDIYPNMLFYSYSSRSRSGRGTTPNTLFWYTSIPQYYPPIVQGWSIPYNSIQFSWTFQPPLHHPTPHSLHCSTSMTIFMLYDTYTYHYWNYPYWRSYHQTCTPSCAGTIQGTHIATYWDGICSSTVWSSLDGGRQVDLVWPTWWAQPWLLGS